MPNYEIYPADIMAVLEVLDHTGGPVTVDSTDFQVTRSGTKLNVYRDMRSIGHMNVGVTKGVVYMGKLEVDEAYRAAGVSTLLIFIALIQGVRSNALSVTLNEDSEVSAYGFWARFGIQVTAGQRSNLVTVLQRFEASQDTLARRLGLSRAPRTMLLNTDRPRASASAAASKGIGPSGTVKRRGSFS